MGLKKAHHIICLCRLSRLVVWALDGDVPLHPAAIRLEYFLKQSTAQRAVMTCSRHVSSLYKNR